MDLNHDLNKLFKSNYLNQTTLAIKQGSILSQVIFNIFMWFIKTVMNAYESGVRVGGKLVN